MLHSKFNCPCSSSMCFRKYLYVSKLSLHILQVYILRFSGISEKSFTTDSILRNFLENFRENIKRHHHEVIQPKYNLIISLDTFLKILSQCWVKRISSVAIIGFQQAFQCNVWSSFESSLKLYVHVTPKCAILISRNIMVGFNFSQVRRRRRIDYLDDGQF